MHLVGVTIEIYYDARSYKTSNILLPFFSYEKPKNQSEACGVINSVYPCACFHKTTNNLTNVHKIIHEYHDTTLCLTIKYHIYAASKRNMGMGVKISPLSIIRSVKTLNMSLSLFFLFFFLTTSYSNMAACRVVRQFHPPVGSR